MEEEEEELESDDREQLFYSTVREMIILLLIYIGVYLISYYTISKFRLRDNEDYFSADDDEETVFRLSMWMCTFSFSVSLYINLLLPFSIASNEVLILYPNSYWIKWLNHSLVQNLWSIVFIFSNISIFISLPFSYLFTESEGIFGFRRRLMSRVHETLIVHFLLTLIFFGVILIIYALIDRESTIYQALWELVVRFNYFSFSFSCISFLGAVMLLLCVPFGFIRLFSIISNHLINPLRDINQEFDIASLEELSFRRKMEQAAVNNKILISSSPVRGPLAKDLTLRPLEKSLQTISPDHLANLVQKRSVLDKQRHTWAFRQNIIYPVFMLILVALTCVTVLMVLQNIVELLIGLKALSADTRQFTLGLSSLSKLGPVGAFLEVVLILYLSATSAVGLHSLPFLNGLCPRLGHTPFTHIIANCTLLNILSCALPVFSKILGITNFDLMGEYKQIQWLGNFQLVLIYNLVFASATTLILFNKCTQTVRRELYNKFKCLPLLFWNSREETSQSVFNKIKKH